MDNRKFTLKPSKPSRHDFDHVKSKGTLGATNLPDSLLFLSTILDQGGSEECTAFSASAIREAMTNHLYDPDRFWQEELQFMGVTSAEGSDVRTQMSVGVKTGFPPQGQPIPTDKASAYFWVRPAWGQDMFDACRMAINQAQAPLSAGVTWYQEWDNPTGIIPHSFDSALGGHCVKIAGFKTINGVPYLVIQNSWGTGHGDNGLFYFDREMTNKCFGFYGVAYWSDSQNDTIKKLGLLSALYANLINLLNQWTH